MSFKMDKNKWDFVNTIKSSLIDYKLPNNINVKAVLYYSKFHTVEVMTYLGLKNNNIECPKEFKNAYDLAVYKAIFQDAERESLKENFEKNMINYMVLKGGVMTDLYPVKGMRQMADLDILIKKEDFKKVKKVVQDLGYKQAELGGNHDSYHKKPFMNIEIHRHLIDVLYDKSFKYYKNIWPKLIGNNNSYEHYFKNEDFYIFMIVHGEKHYSNGGTGIKLLTDIYLYLQKYSDSLDFDYINEELKKLGLYKFGNNIKNLTLKIFNNQTLEENEEIILNYICDSGTYGTTTHFTIIKSFLDDDNDIKKSKKKHLFTRMFPPFKTMKLRNPILNKVPILLPWFYFTRLLFGLSKFKRYRNEIKTLNNISDEDVQKIKKTKTALGLEDKDEN